MLTFLFRCIAKQKRRFEQVENCSDIYFYAKQLTLKLRSDPFCLAIGASPNRWMMQCIPCSTLLPHPSCKDNDGVVKTGRFLSQHSKDPSYILSRSLFQGNTGGTARTELGRECMGD